MAIDLSGSSVVGHNYITSYLEDDPAVGIVASSVQVGMGSATYNTDNIRYIHVRLTQPHPEDEWKIAALPFGIEVSLAYGGPALTLPITVNAFVSPSLYLRSTLPVSDLSWQNALKAISFFADETFAPTRDIVFIAQNSSNMWQTPVSTLIDITPRNDAPRTFADTQEAIEAGGVNNTTPGANATGNVLSNDFDLDNPLQDMVVSAVAFGASNAGPGSSLNGAYGTLTLQSNGAYIYAVNENNAVVQSLRNEHFSVTDTFSYTATDAGGASSTNTLTITIKGQDDTPFDIAVGRHFDGTAASVVADPATLGVSRDFAFELRVSPTNTIALKAQSLSGVAGVSGQEYAVTPLHGQSLWGSTDHVGVGLSVGTNGISVYQHTGDLLSSLLTWSGAVTANAHVAVVFEDNRPYLYVNGTLVATGLQSNKLVHPPTGLGGINWGYFDGGISDFVVWNGPLTAEEVTVRSLDPSLPDGATPALSLLQVRVPENVSEGTVVTTIRARDVDNSDALTYALVSDAQGRFQIHPTTGAVSVAPGAVFDHEAAHELTLTVQVTDLAGQSALHNFTVTIGNVNEAPALINDAVDVSGGLVTLMVDQDHGLWWLDGLGGQRSFIATASAPIVALACTIEGFYFAASADTLYRLDPATGHCLTIGALSTSGSLQMTGLAGTPDGALYGVNSVGNLFFISPSTGAAHPLVTVNSSVSSNGDVAQANGVLYWTTVFGNLMHYDPATGHHGVAMSGLTVITKIIVGSNHESPGHTQVNQRPDVTGPDSLAGQEDRALKITGLNFTDADAGDGSVRVTFELPSGYGVMEASATNQVQVLGNFSRSLTLLGTLTAINAFMAATPGVQFLPDDNVHGQIDLTVTINDMGKAVPIMNWFGGLIGLGEAIYGPLGTQTTVEQFKTAVKQRLQALEDHPHAGAIALSQQVLQQAQKNGTADHLFDISNSIDDFSFALNSQVKVMKSVVVSEVVDGVAETSPDTHFFASDDQITGVASGNNLTGQHVIKVDLANRTGELASYLIRPDAKMTLSDIGLEVNGPLMLIDASGSTVDSTNQFFVHNPNVAIHGGQGEDVYLLSESLRPQVSNADGTKLVAGYIRDGIVSAGRDTVSWAIANSTDEATRQGHSIHMGTGAEGFAAYTGIQHFFGSTFNDVVTRYGDSNSLTMVSVSGGGGRDVFDLRSGNNFVTLSSGEVYFNRAGLASAVEVNRDALNGQGQYTQTASHEALFDNRFDAKNINLVTIEQAGTGLAKVFGHQEAAEVVSVNFGASGLNAKYLTNATTIEGTDYTQRYELSAVSAAATPGAAPQLTLRSVADGAIDGLFGTVHDDTIVIGHGASLKEVHGGGGNDSIDVDVAGIGVYLAQGDSLVKLGTHTSGATLRLGEGNEALITTQTSGSGAAVNVTVYGGDLVDTHVDASGSNEALNVRVQSGKSTILQGDGASEVRVSDSASHVTVSRSNADASLKFLLQDQDGFNLDDLQTADGQLGKFLHTVENGIDVYSTNWYNNYGDFTVLQFRGADLTDVSLEVAGIADSYLLANLIAVPSPAPMPLV